jgi:hypothetical protein
MYSRKLYRWAELGTQIQHSTAAATAACHDLLLDLMFQFLKVPSFSALGMGEAGEIP